MTDVGFAVERASALDVRTRRSVARALTAGVFWAVVVGNVATIVWLWWHGGNVTHVRSTGELLTSIAWITGLLGAYLALLQVVLLSRLPWLERLVGFDKLAFWHRWNGHATLDLVLAHVFFSIWGYATLDKVSIPREIGTMLGGGVYPGMITATIGTALFIAVVASSIVIARRRLPYALRALTREGVFLRKTITSLFAATVLAVPIANAMAAVKAAKKKTIVRTKKFTGATIDTGRYGLLRVTIVVRKTTTIVGTRKIVKRKIRSISVPVYPNDNDRSAFISQNAIPVLVQEALRAQTARIDLVSGATYTSDAFAQSLQAAILAEKKW
jgi:uncharacterized protein with FMN-binding domain